MATADQVVVELEAKTGSYLRNIKNAEQQFVKGLDRIESEANQAGAALGTVGTRGARAFNAASAQAPKAAAAIGGARMQTANLAAQINDIGVTLGSGQSPFMVAIQQGSQINQVIGQAGAAGAVRMLAASFTSLINPVSLATFAIIGLGGTAVQYFTQLLTSTDEAKKSLEDHASLIQGVADKWGEAVPALREYADELRRTAEAADLRQVAGLAAGAEFDELSGLAADASAAIGEVVNEAYRLGSVPVQSLNVLNSQFTRLQNAIDDLEAEYRAGNNTTEEMQAVSAALATILGNNLVEGSDSAVGAINRLSEALGIATGNAQNLVDRVKELEGRGNIPFSEFEGGRGSDPRSFEDDPYWQNRFFPDPERPDNTPSRTGSGGGGGRTSAIERERQAVIDLIDQLEHERSLIGATEVERQKANALRKAGATATEKQRERIAQLTETIYNENAAIKEKERAFQQLQRIGETAINGIATAFADGKLEAEEMLQIVLRLGQQLLSMENIGSGIGGLISSFFGGGGDPWAGLRVPSYSEGTNNHPGGLARINEQGGEIVNLPNGTQVIPHDVSKNMGGANITFAPQIDARGASVEAVGRIEQIMAKQQSEFESKVVATVRGAKKRRIL